MAANPGRDRSPDIPEKSTPAHHFRPWVRLWVSLPTDPKLRVVARLSKQPLPMVVAVFVALLCDAANSNSRGAPDIDAETLAGALDMEHVEVAAILEAMQGRLLLSGRLVGWERRQPIREDDSAPRVSRHRAKRSANVTQRNAL